MNQEEQKILIDLNRIYNKHDILKQMKADFNIFELLLNPYDEVNLHSKMIYGILSEEKFKVQFLFSLLGELGITQIFNIQEQSIKNINIEREKSTPQGRIDIFISFEIKNQLYCIVIENKIWATDQDEQLDRYLFFVDNYNKTGNNYIFYLTLDGHEPSKESCSDIERIELISYDNHILKWLASCIHIAAKENHIREILIQYEEIVERITGKDNDILMELKDYILESSNNFDLANNMESALTEAKIDLQLKFWENLEVGLKEHLKDKYDIEYQDTFENSKLGEVNPKYSKDIIRRFHTTRRGSTNYGILYKICEIEEIGPIYLKIEINRDSIYFGIRKKVTTINETSAEYEKLLDKLSKNYALTSKEWWVAWKHLMLRNNIVNFSTISKEFAEILIDDNKLNGFIVTCLEQIDELIKIILRD